MNKTFRKFSLKSVLPLALLFFIIAAALLIYTKLGIFTLLKGPVPIENLTPDELVGSYVQVDIANMRGEFASWTLSGSESSSESDDGSSTTGEITREYMGLSFGDDQYLGVCFYKRHMEDLNKMVSALNLLYGGEIDKINLSIKHSGTVVEMEPALQEYFYKWFDGTTLPESKNDADYVESDHLYPYLIEFGRVGGVPDTIILILSACAALFILLGLALLLAAASGFFQRGARRTMRETEIDAALIQSDFKSAKKIGPLWVGESFVWFFRGPFTVAQPVEEMLWVFPRSKRLEGGKTRWKFVFRTKDRTETEIKMKSGGEIQEAADTLLETGAALVVGYDKEKQALYTRDLQTFQSMAKREAKKRAQTAE